MINHVVLFKLNDYPADEKRKILLELKSLLEGLKDKIEELISHFESEADLDVYRVHPEHKKVLTRILEATSARAAVDYEF